jgi:hypothetical protein
MWNELSEIELRLTKKSFLKELVKLPCSGKGCHGFTSLKPSGITILIGILLLVPTFLAKIAHDRQSSFFQAGAETVVVVPKTLPPLTQESVELALELYNIAVPDNCLFPKYDDHLIDRGLTMQRGTIARSIVKVGSPAFASWALLGSTLAHELEIHCHQNMTLSHFKDKLGFDGSGELEREAYFHELKYSERFGLNKAEKWSIATTVMHFYPSTRPERGFADYLNVALNAKGLHLTEK